MLFQQPLRSSHICWALVGCFSFILRSNWSQTISIWLRSGDCVCQIIWYSTLLLGQIVHTQSGSVLGHCPVEKQMIVPLSARLDGISLQNAVVAILVKCALNSKLITDSDTYKAPPHHPTSSMLHGGNHTCGGHPFTHSAYHKDKAVATKNLWWTWSFTK